MAEYFDKFPNILYKIDEKAPYQAVINLTVRLGIIERALSNAFNYYEYSVKDGETADILANRYYGNSELHWLILLTNKILDPQYDWPLDSRSFQAYLVDKYGSIATAKTTYQKWYAVNKSLDSASLETTIRKFPLTSDDYDSSSLPTDPGDGEVYTVGSYTVTLWQYKTREFAYDIEEEANEAKRNIKLLKKEYVSSIRDELNTLLRAAGGPRLNPLRSLGF